MLLWSRGNAPGDPVEFVSLTSAFLLPAADSTAGMLQASEQERALREFTCSLCKLILRDPMSTPCGHHFCKPCLEKRFAVRLITLSVQHFKGAPTKLEIGTMS